MSLKCASLQCPGLTAVWCLTTCWQIHSEDQSGPFEVLRCPAHMNIITTHYHLTIISHYQKHYNHSLVWFDWWKWEQHLPALFTLFISLLTSLVKYNYNICSVPVLGLKSFWLILLLCSYNLNILCKYTVVLAVLFISPPLSLSNFSSDFKEIWQILFTYYCLLIHVFRNLSVYCKSSYLQKNIQAS